ncbi:MAG: sigma-54-dependent Fis family transcriptional regulator [Bacteroidaceae bacterium]|nr:sigma-54-dependent Fis family transcriptional regulator [Bacteroidaceae bacterium]
MAKTKTILIIDDNRGVLSALKLLLKDTFGHIIALPSPVTLPSVLRSENPDVVLLDMNFSDALNSGNEGLYWLHEIKRMHPALPVVLFTAYADIDLAVRGIKEGATDFVVKPWDNAKLIETLKKACEQTSKGRKKKEERTHSAMYWGASAPMRELRAMVEKVATTDTNVLITGENGTGKEMLAREIHALSNRFRRDMVTVDMGAVTETLFESELFGHKKGAFTDAHADRAGKFEAANAGTIFLDEIGNLPYHLQAKLLTVLQSRSVVRVGSNEPIPVDVRLICATNADLDERVAQGKFREDLLYRINTIHLEIPPLRERKEDIIPLAELFIARFAKQYDKGTMTLSEDAKRKLKEHPWYGNIRELEHAIEKAVIISDSGVAICDAGFHFPKKSLTPTRDSEAETLEDMELVMIRKAIDKHGGNLSAVAAQLGITRQTLYNKMKKYGL